MLNHQGNELTYLALFYFFCREGKDQKYLYHNIDDGICYVSSRWEFHIGLESSKKVFDSIEEVQECALARASTLNRLIGLVVNKEHGKKRDRQILTERREAMPVKITPAGG